MSGKPDSKKESRAADRAREQREHRTDLERRARTGEVEAQYQLARIHMRGDGVSRDWNAARGWYECAAAADDPRALYALGRVYEDGRGVQADPAKAATLYARAAGRMGGALVRLAVLHADGRGLPRDRRKAWDLLRRAAMEGLDRAVEPLARLANEAPEVPEAAAEAAVWRQACDWVAAKRYPAFLRAAMPILTGSPVALRERSFQYDALLIADEYRREGFAAHNPRHALWWYDHVLRGDHPEPAAIAHEGIADILAAQANGDGISAAIEHYAKAVALGHKTAAPKQLVLERSMMPPLRRAIDGLHLPDWQKRLGEIRRIAAYGLMITAIGLGGAYLADALPGSRKLVGLGVFAAAGGALVFCMALLLGAATALRGSIGKGRARGLVAILVLVGAAGAYYYFELRSPSSTADSRAMAAYAEGNRHFAADRFGLAEQAYDAALAAEPAAAYHLARGNARLAQQRYSDAADDYDLAIKLEPGHAPAYLARGTLHWLQGRVDIAEGDYRAAIRLKPDDDFYYGRLAAVLYERGRVTDVADTYRQAFEQDRSRDWALNGWFGALVEQKDYDGILDQTSRLRSEGVSAAWLEYYEGLAEEVRGNDRPALTAYLRAIAADAYGVDLDVYAKIATLYRKFGAIGECENYQRKYFSLLSRPDGYDKAWCQS